MLFIKCMVRARGRGMDRKTGWKGGVQGHEWMVKIKEARQRGDTSARTYSQGASTD